MIMLNAVMWSCVGRRCVRSVKTFSSWCCVSLSFCRTCRKLESTLVSLSTCDW